MTHSSSNGSISTPLAWLATTGALFAGMMIFNPTIVCAYAAAIVSSLSIVGLSAFQKTEPKSFVVPLLGSILFASLTWIVTSMMPSGLIDPAVPVEMATMAKLIVAMTFCILIMPVLALGELFLSSILVQSLSKFGGGTHLSGELRVVKMIERKFGGMLGTINR